MRKLRSYQLECANRVKEILRRGQDPLLVAPTGAGKTAIIGKVINDLSRNRSIRTLVIVPRKSLVIQTMRELEDQWGLDVGAIAGTLRESRRAQVQVATYQAIATRGIDWLRPDYTMLDEAHLSAFPKCIRDWIPDVNTYWKHKNRTIGVTATPRRNDKYTSLGELFLPENIIFAPSIAQLIRMGHLVRPVYAITPNAISGQMIFDPDYIMSVYRITDKRPTIVFAPSVSKAQAMAERFNEEGIEAYCVTGSTTNREKIFNRFRNEEIPVLVSCQVLREGIDLPCATNLILAIDPDSHSSYVQVMGRFARTCTYRDGTVKTHFSVYDLTGCVDRHGRIEELVYTPDDINLPDIQPGEVPTKPCPDPDCEIRSYISATHCACGCEFDLKTKRTVAPEGVPFALLSGTERIHKAFYEEELVAAFERGDRPSSARHRFYATFGYTPPLLWRRSFQYSPELDNWLLTDGSQISSNGEWRQLALELDF
jgi:DNA repair protein RadD